MNYFLNLDLDVYQHTLFPPKGKINEVGLTSPGLSTPYGVYQIWEQDQSIMGWTCGYGISSGLDVARFYYDLLGPEHKILSKESTDLMEQFKILDIGFAAGHMEYGGGLMRLHASHVKDSSEVNNATYIGHQGDTYGFVSAQGFFSSGNFSISLILNVDFSSPSSLFCPIT